MTSAGVSSNDSDPRIFCFEGNAYQREFEASVTSLIARLQDRSRKMFVSEHNVLRMNHGSSWLHSAREPEPDTTMHTISAETVIPFKGIAENDLGLIAETILPISEEMERQFTQNMYGLIGAGAEKVGNVVDAKQAGSFPLSMLEMFRKIEIDVDRDGNVSMPQIHVGSDMYERVTTEMQNVPTELAAEFEQVKAEKIRLAHEREVARKAKFKRADE